MPVATNYRSASLDEMAREIDRRGRAIEVLEGRLEAIQQAFYLPDAERRQFYLTDQLKTFGHFGRAGLCEKFKVSAPQASLDIQRWLREHPGEAVYNTSSRHYDRCATPHQGGE